MDKDILVKLVKKEASKLKKETILKERKRLSFSKLNAESPLACIYGQMTGSCWSSRASTLIEKCAERVYNQKSTEDLNECSLNGKPKVNVSGDRIGSYFSPIECFIYFDENVENGNNKRLINYLKGKSRTLSLKKF